MGYTRGIFMRQAIRCELHDEGIALSFGEREGSFHPWWRQLRITVHGWQGAASARIGDRAVPVVVNAKQHTASLLLDDQPHAAQLQLRRTAGTAAAAAKH
jgi:alpha-glucosidase